MLFTDLGTGLCSEYLNRVIFHQKRSFTHAQFWKFMTEQSKPYPQMIELIRRLKARHKLKIAALSNEGSELNAYRIGKFKLAGLIDFFISSCYVHLHKPDADIFHLALDVAQTPLKQIVYIENTALFVQVAEGMGMRSIHHTDYQSTRAQLAALGLDICEQDQEAAPVPRSSGAIPQAGAKTDRYRQRTGRRLKRPVASPSNES